jgi:hypothetical protein
MSDLSRLLGDLYGDESPGNATVTSWDAVPPPDEPPPPKAPSWSSDEALDEMFASWVPGEPAEAPAPPAMFDTSELQPEPELDDWTVELRAAAAAPIESATPAPVEQPQPTVAPIEPLPEAVAPIEPLPEAVAPAIPSTTFDEVFAPVVSPEDVMIAPALVAERARWSPSDDDILPARKKRRR